MYVIFFAIFLTSFMDKLVDISGVASNNLTPNSHLEVEIENYVNLNVTVSTQDRELAKSQGALYFYKLYERSFPILTSVAKSILAITATSVPSECLFSKAGLIETDLRNRLNPSRLEQLTFIKANM